MTQEAFEAIVRRALVELQVEEVALISVSTAADGEAMRAEVRLSPRGEAAARQVSIAVPRSEDAAHVASETRAELRRALRMCPLCQRIGHVEKLRGAAGQHEGCIVRCPACGEFEIDQELIRRFRSAWERHDPAILDRLPSLSERTRAGAPVRITADNWQGGGSWPLTEPRSSSSRTRRRSRQGWCRHRADVEGAPVADGDDNARAAGGGMHRTFADGIALPFRETSSPSTWTSPGAQALSLCRQSRATYRAARYTSNRNR